jgi:hypothetical protein
MEMTFYNQSDELTFSADGITYSYVGRATQAGIIQAGNDAVENHCGYSTYTISWAGDIVVALPLKTNGATVLIDATQSGTTWTITVMKANGTQDGLAFPNQEYTEVYVFGAPPGNATSQFMLYDGSGVPSGDLSRQPLLSKGLLSLSSDSTNTTWTPPSAIASPAILGAPPGYRRTSVFSSGKWTNREFSYGWILESSGAVSRVSFLASWYRDDASIGNTTVLYQTAAIMTTVAGL